MTMEPAPLHTALKDLCACARAAYNRGDVAEGHRYAKAYHKVADALVLVTGVDPRPQVEAA